MPCGANDDGPEGDEIAITGMKSAIVDLARITFESWQLPPEQQLIVVPYFDFYGIVDIEVWAPAYYLGRALHALQDSFAHTIRSDDLSQIRHVLNYVDAIEGHLSEARDGLPHSAHMDSCDGDTLPIVMTAVTASAELIAAVNLTVACGAFNRRKWSSRSGLNMSQDARLKTIIAILLGLP